MKNVKIKFLDAGIKDYYQYSIIVKDANGCICFDGKTYNGEVCFMAKENTCLTIEVNSFRGCMVKSLYVRGSDKEVLLYYGSKKRTSPVTFILTDEYYDNLPIMEGELFYE